MSTPPSDETHAALSAVFREDAGRLVGALTRLPGNFEEAEELVQDARYRDKLAALEQTVVQEPDGRLRLIFTCCHASLSRESQVALTLRAICGFTTTELAHAFLTSEATMARRIVRARQKIVQAGIPYRAPRAEELDERLSEVLAVLYRMFNEGYLTSRVPPRPDRGSSLVDRVHHAALPQGAGRPWTARPHEAASGARRGAF
jgi:predicted RNA polymerase sigma factor